MKKPDRRDGTPVARPAAPDGRTAGARPLPAPVALAMAVLAGLLASCASTPKSNPLDSMPPPIVAWEGADSVTLPLEFVGAGGRLTSVIVELAINGERARFVVDSGSNTTWFTREFTRDLNARESGQKITIRGAVGTGKPDLVILDAMDFGFARLSRVGVTSGDVLQDMNRALIAGGEYPVAGLLGLDILAPLGASIDLSRSTLTFHRAPAPRPAGTGSAGAGQGPSGGR